jgi:hypothetical protein
MPPQTDAEIAARAAYRIGLLDAMLHEDSIKALTPPGIIVQNMRGERKYRISELESIGVSMEKLEDLTLNAS